MVCQLHQLLLELLPGGAKKDLSAAQARRLLAGVRPKDVAGKTRKRVALELVADPGRLYRRKKEANKELIDLVKATGTGLPGLHGIGPSGAARLLAGVGDITRFPTKGHFASWTGTAPVDASSGDNVRHRLSRGGNRQASKALHMMAVVQLRNPTLGRAYYDRKVAAGKTPNEAMRCLKRRLSDLACKTMPGDLVADAGRAREDTGETSLIPARPARIPTPALQRREVGQARPVYRLHGGTESPFRRLLVTSQPGREAYRSAGWHAWDTSPMPISDGDGAASWPCLPRC